MWTTGMHGLSSSPPSIPTILLYTHYTAHYTIAFTALSLSLIINMWHKKRVFLSVAVLKKSGMWNKLKSAINTFYTKIWADITILLQGMEHSLTITTEVTPPAASMTSFTSIFAFLVTTVTICTRVGVTYSTVSGDPDIDTDLSPLTSDPSNRRSQYSHVTVMWHTWGNLYFGTWISL